MFRRSIQYSITIVNMILVIYAVLKFDSNFVPLIINSRGEPLIEIGKWFIIAFGIIPVLLILSINYFDKRRLKKENGENYIYYYKGKVMPIMLVIMILISWITVLVYKTRQINNDVNRTKWLIIGIGAVLMYCSNYIDQVKTTSFIARKIPRRLKDESLWNKMVNITADSFAVGSYLIMMAGVEGLIYNSEYIVAVGFIIGFLCLFIPSIIYVISLEKKLKKKSINVKNTRKDS